MSKISRKEYPIYPSTHFKIFLKESEKKISLRAFQKGKLLTEKKKDNHK